MNQETHTERGIIAWFARNHVAANVLMLFLITAGAIRLSTMVREIFPPVEPHLITVTVPFPGASPEDIERGITRRIEEAVIGVQGVERVESTAREGIATVRIETSEFTEGTEVMNEVETEIDGLLDFPPEGAEEVAVSRVKRTARVMRLALYGNVDRSILRYWAEQLEDRIQQLPEVSLVGISGIQEREISISVEEVQLRKYDITLREIAQRVSQFSVDLPAGVLRAETAEILVRVKEKRRYGEEFGDIVVRAESDGSLVRLRDIASIRDGLSDEAVLSSFNGIPAVFLNVSRTASQDALQIESAINRMLTTLSLPSGITATVWRNETEILRDRINLLIRNALIGFALVFLVLMLFLDLKLAVWTALGIPISILGGIFLSSSFGVTINMITLFAMIVVLGIVVDDAIVTGESIFTEQQKGRKGIAAALHGVRRIVAPVTIGVTTTIAAFLPLLFSTGTLGQILRPIPLVVIGILLTSLLEAYFILPAHLSSASRWSRGYLARLNRQVAAALERITLQLIIPGAQLAIRLRYITVTGAFLFVGASLLLLYAGILRFIFFPQIEGDRLLATLEMEAGTPISTTEKHAQNILAAALQVQETLTKKDVAKEGLFKNTALVVGSVSGGERSPNSQARTQRGSNLAEISIELIPADTRTVRAGEIERLWRQRVGHIPGARQLSFQSNLVEAGKDITFELNHPSHTTLYEASNALQSKMREMEGLSEITDSAPLGKLEYQFRPNQIGLAAGLTPLSLGRQLRNAFEGNEIQRIQRADAEVEVTVQYAQSLRHSLGALEQFRVELPDGSSAALATVAEVTEERNISTIQSVGGRRIVTVTANVDEQVRTPRDAISYLNETVLPKLKETYPDLSARLEGESRDQREDLRALGKNMLIALFLILVLLSGQLRSYGKPLVIIMTVPLGISGAIIGHVLLGYDLSFVSLFGMVALSGVVINDSIVLVDYYNTQLQQGETPHDAAVAAVARRFRPILLTTLTTSFGLLPMLLETSLQARFIIPMAVSLACGIVIASTLLIFLIPALLLVGEDFRKVVARSM